MTARGKKTGVKDDAAQKAAVVEAALAHVPFDGFTDKVLQAAGKEAGLAKAEIAHLFPKGPLSLVETWSGMVDAEMERRLARLKLSDMKVRDRIRTAVRTRLAILKPHKEAARRAVAFLSLPPHVGLGARLVYRTVDSMWRAAGDTATDFNFYTKRGILAGVYSATLMRWFTDTAKDEQATDDFLKARIDNVMRFEKFKAQVKEKTRNLPSVTDIFERLAARRS